ncbi:hypothetical protein SARC_04813 [Sphaeroforma arctica JP610]|uniref:Uncharacterized protein n=1 Tax=Sphaeroforma arctica JP610 TaxID=667725 RepID=A0A0L0G1E4_9EUKA|nr:hypothetical protein SARC_04813 [Sphaeroforma arctica JP610]KNC82920.1 hypothetical protein SARC_04813 [Sphaeroforma arctica JP610]|eukprot:XP_014156822.1 hypothetical protein SARC_04813 [Sphaeroforma arctica JP610]
MRIKLYKPLPDQQLVLYSDACKTAVGMTLFVHIPGGILRFVVEEVTDAYLVDRALEAAKLQAIAEPDVGLENLAT